MKRLACVIALAAAPLAAASERALDGEGMRAKAIAAAAHLHTAPREAAPFRVVHEPIPELFPRVAPLEPKSRGACDAHGRALCYDALERRIVYRPARELMPAIDGMKAESMSLRHGRLTLKYSFR